jgi:hypothetical protein
LFENHISYFPTLFENHTSFLTTPATPAPQHFGTNKVHEKRGNAECDWTPNDQKWQETQKKQEGKGYTGSKRDG